jgi:hypothetical protein
VHRPRGARTRVLCVFARFRFSFIVQLPLDSMWWAAAANQVARFAIDHFTRTSDDMSRLAAVQGNAVAGCRVTLRHGVVQDVLDPRNTPAAGGGGGDTSLHHTGRNNASQFQSRVMKRPPPPPPSPVMHQTMDGWTHVSVQRMATKGSKALYHDPVATIDDSREVP